MYLIRFRNRIRSGLRILGLARVVCTKCTCYIILPIILYIVLFHDCLCALVLFAREPLLAATLPRVTFKLYLMVLRPMKNYLATMVPKSSMKRLIALSEKRNLICILAFASLNFWKPTNVPHLYFWPVANFAQCRSIILFYINNTLFFIPSKI